MSRFPNPYLFFTEGFRSVKESKYTHEPPVQDGSSRAIITLPGMLASDISTIGLRKYLLKRKFLPYRWGCGRNLPHRWEETQKTLSQKVLQLSDLEGQIGLVGWSLGGIHARELAREHPERISHVVSIGSPIQSKWFSKRKQIEPPPVPCTAIYSKNDGIVPWQQCLEIEYDNTYNHEVTSSHLGMGWNPEVLDAVGNALQK